jgi:Tfp pilus assembly protein FimT
VGRSNSKREFTLIELLVVIAPHSIWASSVPIERDASVKKS